MQKTLDEIKRILETPPISHEKFREYILAEYDKYAKMLGWSGYAEYKEWCAKNKSPNIE